MPNITRAAPPAAADAVTRAPSHTLPRRVRIGAGTPVRPAVHLRMHEAPALLTQRRIAAAATLLRSRRAVHPIFTFAVISAVVEILLDPSGLPEPIAWRIIPGRSLAVEATASPRRMQSAAARRTLRTVTTAIVTGAPIRAAGGPIQEQAATVAVTPQVTGLGAMVVAATGTRTLCASGMATATGARIATGPGIIITASSGTVCG